MSRPDPGSLGSSSPPKRKPERPRQTTYEHSRHSEQGRGTLYKSRTRLTARLHNSLRHRTAAYLLSVIFFFAHRIFSIFFVIYFSSKAIISASKTVCRLLLSLPYHPSDTTARDLANALTKQQPQACLTERGVQSRSRGTGRPTTYPSDP